MSNRMWPLYRRDKGKYYVKIVCAVHIIVIVSWCYIIVHNNEKWWGFFAVIPNSEKWSFAASLAVAWAPCLCVITILTISNVNNQAIMVLTEQTNIRPKEITLCRDDQH